MITALIPARKDDQNLKNKNILPFANSNLLVHKIAQLKKCELVNEIIVSTDSAKIGKIAESSGATVNIRPTRLSSTDADFNQLCDYIASIIGTPHVLWAPVTTPLVTSYAFDDAIKTYFQVIEEGFDSLISVNKIKRFLLDNNGPLNFRFNKSKRDQASLPVLFEFINAISICSVNDMKLWQYNWGKIPYKYPLPVSMQVDICDSFDYELAKLVYGAQFELFN